MAEVKDLKPKALFQQFAEILKIPRCSGSEGKIRDYMVDFAKKRGFSYKTDEVGNVVIQVPATKGLEKAPIVVLQGHLDMVCEKHPDYQHDFEKDPIPAIVEGDIIKTKGTTLGADNGIGVATGLGIADDPDAKHGPLELLFTIDEERGLTGAGNLKEDMLDGRLLLNLDSEDEGVLFVGCAGGADSVTSFPIELNAPGAGSTALNIRVSGLMGGHSGLNIIDNRANSLKIMSRLLFHTRDAWTQLLDFKGGDKRNAIPRDAWITVVLPVAKADGFKKAVADFAAVLKDEFKNADPGLEITVEPAELPKEAWSAGLSTRLINTIMALPHGVLAMSTELEGIVQTSSNVASIETSGNNIDIVCSSRSSVDSEIKYILNRIAATGALAGANVEFQGSYPGWRPNMDAKTLKFTREAYKEMTGKEPEVTVIHAGLETGILGNHFPGMDMVSLGPNMRNVHTPEEFVEIGSTGRFYELVKLVLKNIAFA